MTLSSTTLYFRLEKMPMLRILPLVAMGIAVGLGGGVPWWLSAVGFLCAGVLSIKLRSGIALAGMLLFAGMTAAGSEESEESVPRGTNIDLTLKISTILRPNRAEAEIEAWRTTNEEEWHATDERILIWGDSLIGFRPSERIIASARIRHFGGKFPSYRDLMESRGFVGQATIYPPNILSRECLPRSLHCKAVERIAALGLPSASEAVVRAMVAGDRSRLDTARRAAYADSGFAHLLAVSGLHTGIIFVWINVLLGWMPLLRWGHLLRNILAVGAIWVYVAVTGGAPSVVRSAMMYSILQLTLAYGSEYRSLNALAGAAVVMLLFNPRWISDLSFQLSVLSVGGIIAWGVPLCRSFRVRWFPLRWMIDSLMISAVASLSTAPLVSHAFGRFSAAGCLLNPAAILLALGIVAVGTTWLVVPWDGWQAVIGWVLNHLTSALNALTDYTASLPAARMDYALSTEGTIIIYLVFGAATLALWSKEPKKALPLQYDNDNL